MGCVFEVFYFGEQSLPGRSADRNETCRLRKLEKADRLGVGMPGSALQDRTGPRGAGSGMGAHHDANRQIGASSFDETFRSNLERHIGGAGETHHRWLTVPQPTRPADRRRADDWAPRGDTIPVAIQP
jgi:hypothetical protein